MRKANRSASDRLIEQRLAETPMSEHERDHALRLLRDAEGIAEGIMWAKERIASLGALFMKPSLKN